MTEDQAPASGSRGRRSITALVVLAATGVVLALMTLELVIVLAIFD